MAWAPLPNWAKAVLRPRSATGRTGWQHSKLAPRRGPVDRSALARPSLAPSGFSPPAWSACPCLPTQLLHSAAAQRRAGPSETYTRGAQPSHHVPICGLCVRIDPRCLMPLRAPENGRKQGEPFCHHRLGGRGCRGACGGGRGRHGGGKGVSGCLRARCRCCRCCCSAG
jgi:hypothetical protein